MRGINVIHTPCKEPSIQKRIMFFNIRIVLFCMLNLISPISAHARIRRPIPLAAVPENPSGNEYNKPLRIQGNESPFPCKNLHKKAGVNKTPTEVWQAGRMTRFELVRFI